MWFYCCFWASFALVLWVVHNFFIQIMFFLRIIALNHVSVGLTIFIFLQNIRITFIKQSLSVGSIVWFITMILQEVSFTKEIPILVTANLFCLGEIFRTVLTLETMTMEK